MNIAADIQRYTVSLDTDEPVMLINQHIGFDDQLGYGVMGADFQNELLYLDTLGKKRIQVWINSPGGTVLDGMSIYNAILKSKTKVDTYCVGIAASIAAVIFQAGRKRTMADYAQLMYHNPSGGTNKELDAVTQSLCKMITARSGKSEDEVTKMMNRSSWINAEDALASGMCDEIESSTSMNKPRQAPSTDMKMMWQSANQIINKIFNLDSMKKIAAKLGLKEDAPEEEILAAIEKQQKETVVKVEGSELLNEITNTLGTELKKFGDSHKAVTDDLKNRLDAIDNADKKIKATALINEFKNRLGDNAAQDVVDTWVAEAVKDYDGTKKLLEKLPVNKTAVKLTDTLGADGKSKVGSVIMSTMAELRDNLKMN